MRKKIEAQDYIGALQIIDEIDEMSRDDKLNKIYSYMVILLLHLIKQQDEAYPRSIKEASFEAFEGKLTVNQLEEKVDRDLIKSKAISFLECN